jgi:hypothetical protein
MGRSRVSDIVFVAAMFALTAVAALFVLACNSLIGPDDKALAEGGPEEVLEPPAEVGGAGR